MPPDPFTARKARTPTCVLCNCVRVPRARRGLPRAPLSPPHFPLIPPWPAVFSPQTITAAHFKCADSAIDMCYACFTSGVESPAHPLHKRGSPYRVMDNLAAHAVFADPGWTAADELALLDAIEIYGLGNWRDCANYVGGGRTDAQVARHYTRVYLEGPNAPLPSAGGPAAGEGAPAAAAAAPASEAAAAGGAGVASAPDATLGAGAMDEGSVGGGGGGGGGGVEEGGGASAVGGRSGTSGHLSATPGYSSAHVPRTDIAGYLPLRGDFDVEWENDAEAVLGDLDFVEGEHVTETELKLKILEIYNAKLDERERRKAFIIERGLLDYKRLLSAERRRPREEREIYDAFRPFARFLSPKEHEDLVRGIILEHR
jgi:transcriptional adapter 2-alpha